MRFHRALIRHLPAAALLAGASLLPARSIVAQGGYFGQNQVQYEKFDWRVYKSDHFDVHYYPAMAEGARIATRKLWGRA
jgi:hypothetical protein